MNDEKYKAKLAKLSDQELIRNWYVSHERFMRSRDSSKNEFKYHREEILTAMDLMERGYVGEKTTIWKKVK